MVSVAVGEEHGVDALESEAQALLAQVGRSIDQDHPLVPLRMSDFRIKHA